MIQLLEHNKETYERLCDVLADNNKCALVQATGTGKSYIAGKYIEEHANAALILVPTNAIADAWSDLLSGIEQEVDIITYQAFAKEPNNYLEYDLVIADEMHHLGSDVWGKKFVETYLQSENHKIVGLTATEIRYLDNSRDMAEEIFENIRVDGCDLPTAINTGVLPTFKYVSALYCDESDFDEWREKTGKIKDIKTQTELKGRLDVCIKNMVSVKQAVNENLADDYNKIIVFLNNVESKETALEMFKDVFPTANFYDVDYGKSRSENNSQIGKFKADSSRAVLFSVDMLNEGIHVKGTDCIIMFRKTVSPQVYLQQLGRGLASGTDKMPIIFDFVSNTTNINLKLNQNGNDTIIMNWNRRIHNDVKIIVKSYSKTVYDVFSDIEKIIVKKNWSKEEIDFLVSNICSMTCKEIAEELGRTKIAVWQKVREMGLRAKPEVNHYTEYEINFIKENYGKMKHVDIAKILQRNAGSINNLAKQLGLTNKVIVEWNEKEIEIIKDEYESIGAKGIIEKYNILKTQSQIACKARELGISRKENKAWTDEEIEYLKKNKGKSYNELSAVLGRSNFSIQQKMKREGILDRKKNLRTVYQFNKSGIFIREYESITACAKHFNVGSSSIKAAIKHNYTINDYYFFHTKEFIVKEKTYSKRKVVKLDKNYNLIKIFDSVKEATEESGLATLRGRISNPDRNAIKEKEFIWIYEEDYNNMIAEQKGGN